MKKQSKTKKCLKRTNESACRVGYFLYFVVGLGVAVIWTLAGVVIAFLQGDLKTFIAEWLSLQGSFLIWFGTWLVLIARSGALIDRASRISIDGSIVTEGIIGRRTRVLIAGTIAVAGTASLIGMGFNASGAIQLFMWGTAGAVCVAAGVVTLHTVDLIMVIHKLQFRGIKTFQYAPARTPELRNLINYFTTFTLILSIAYSFAFAGTMKGHWTGRQDYIEAVQFFWPLIYVPICSAALIYPHLAMHGLIKKSKEQILISYQSEIDNLLINYKSLDNEGVQKVNSLVQLFDRISGTPDYVVDLGIAIRTSLPLLFNVAIIVAKPILGQT
ncbi:MAG: hypothetical protein HXX10_10340 [Rhodoplanes sp.]|uniref:hypothetical protein n=1 Tax=Rhodoplanes sp. TaxID=1968906 RepID=UPI00185D738B|nr:hypothetical protein [Rhodoplanes sp.]NVO14424.1 hypothetical protein [Rhodoplanes sp.]